MTAAVHSARKLRNRSSGHARDVDASELQWMLKRMIDAGITTADLSRAAGVSPNVITSIAKGIRKKASPSAYVKIMSGLGGILPQQPHPDSYHWPTGDAAQDHIRDLVEDGYSVLHIADIIGQEEDSVHRIRVFGDKIKIHPADEVLILAIEPGIRNRIPSKIGITRRVRGLVAWGHSPRTIASEANVPVKLVDQILSGKEQPDNVAVRIRFGKAFNKLEHIRGTCELSIQRGDDNDWPVPFQWDEYSIDHEDAKPLGKYQPMLRVIDPEKKMDVWRREVEALADLAADV